MNASKSLKVLAAVALLSASMATVRASADEDLATIISKGAKLTYHGTKKVLKKLGHETVKTTIIVKDGIIYGADKTAEGAVYAMNKTKEGIVLAGEKTKEGVVLAADKTGEGLKAGYEGAKEGTETAYSKALKPYIVAPVVELSHLTVVDGVYHVVLEPFGKGSNAMVKNDVVDGVKVYGTTLADGSHTLYDNSKSDTIAVYRATLIPIGHGAVKTGHGIVFLSCSAANSFRDSPKECSQPKVSSEMEVGI